MDDEILNQIKTNILEASTLQKLQMYTVQLQNRINFLMSQFKSKPPDTSNVFNNHFC